MGSKFKVVHKDSGSFSQEITILAVSRLGKIESQNQNGQCENRMEHYFMLNCIISSCFIFYFDVNSSSQCFSLMHEIWKDGNMGQTVVGNNTDYTKYLYRHLTFCRMGDFSELCMMPAMI